MKSKLSLALAVAGCALALTQFPASATTVATIDGCYDCLGSFDTTTLTFENTLPGGGVFTNAQMVLSVSPTENSGLITQNNGVTQTVTLGTLPNGNTNVVWNGPGTLFANDYDDSVPGTAACPPNPISASLCGNPGNFKIVFTATIAGTGTGLDGQPVFSVFSPSSNNTGSFVGFEGLDPTGLSETQQYDQHNGGGSCSLNCTSGGTLALIDIGIPPTVPGPIAGAGLPGLIAACGGLIALVRRRRQLVV